MIYDTLREQALRYDREGRFADLGALLMREVDTVTRALLVAGAVEEAGLRADLECGHVVPEDDVVGCEDGGDICRACADSMDADERGGHHA